MFQAFFCNHPRCVFHQKPIVYLVADYPQYGRDQFRERFFTDISAKLKKVDILQFRDKTSTADQFLAIAGTLRHMTYDMHIPFIISGRMDLAKAVNADGVHIVEPGQLVMQARQILGKDAIIGLSIKDTREAEQVEKFDIDYLGVGPIFETFETLTKQDAEPALGITQLCAIKKITKFPIVAIGGINRSNIQSVIRTGVNGVAVISDLLDTKDIHDLTHLMQ